MTIQQLSIFVENTPGRLADITAIIGDQGVDIRALSIADTSDFGILRLIVDKPQQAVEALKAAGLTVTLTDVVAVGIDDSPGAFARMARLMSDRGVEIEYMYAFINRSGADALVILRIEDIKRGVEALQQAGIRLLAPDEVYEL